MQQRFVLGAGYCVLHQVALLRHQLMYTAVGVYVGIEPSGFIDAGVDINVFTASGVALSIASGRLSYTLGLIGPCYSIDTACASSLVSLHSC